MNANRRPPPEMAISILVTVLAVNAARIGTVASRTPILFDSTKDVTDTAAE